MEKSNLSTMKADGVITLLIAKVHTSLQMEAITKVSGKTMKRTDADCMFTAMEISTKASF